jgi:hypothetical protein
VDHTPVPGSPVVSSSTETFTLQALSVIPDSRVKNQLPPGMGNTRCGANPLATWLSHPSLSGTGE